LVIATLSGISLDVKLMASFFPEFILIIFTAPYNHSISITIATLINNTLTLWAFMIIHKR